MVPSWMTGRVAPALTLTALLLCMPARAAAAELQQHTLDAWERYVRLTEQRITDELDDGRSFLVMDFEGTEDARLLREQLRDREIHVERLETRDGGRRIDVDDGLIHHWIGAVFVPGAELDGLLEWLKKYDDHEEYFPEVEQSRLISEDGERYDFFFRLRRHKVITVVYNTEHTAVYRSHGPQRASSSSVATRIAQLDNPGTPQEHEQPIGSDGGYLWRLNAYWRFEQADGGVYVECESISLSRGIPFGFGWILRGLVNSVPRESLESTLTSLRNGYSHVTE